MYISNTLPHNRGQSIAFDRMNTVWIGTAGGAAGMLAVLD